MQQQRALWEIAALIFGSLGGLKAVADLWLIVFGGPRIKGEVEFHRWDSDPKRPRGDLLLLYATVTNTRPRATDVKRWKAVLDFGGAREETIESVTLGANHWDDTREENRPSDATPFPVTSHFEQYILKRGWLGFPVELGHDTPARIRVVAVDARNKEHRLRTYEWPK